MRLHRVRNAARRDKDLRFTALLHHVSMHRLKEAFRSLRKDASPGVDGVTWREYAVNLDENLKSLHSRLHKGTYKAPPTRRSYIDKEDGRQRPLGIATIEDKVAQKALADVLNAIYEEDFIGFSYGFRPGRSPHDALNALAVAIERKYVNWVLDADIRGFFDAINHEWLMKLLKRRIGDKRVLRLIARWLKAGILEDGRLYSMDEGTPQGALSRHYWRTSIYTMPLMYGSTTGALKRP